MATPSFVPGTFTTRTVSSGATSSDSFSFDSGATGANRVLVFMWSTDSAGNPTSATYNGAAVTIRSFTTSQFFTSWGYIIAPPTGSHTFVINYPSQSRAVYNIFVLQDVDQSNVFQFDGTANGTGGTFATTLNTTTADQLVISWLSNGAGASITVDAGQTTDYNAKPYSFPIALSHNTPNTTTNVTHTYTGTSGGGWQTGMVSFLYGASSVSITVSASVLSLTSSIPSATVTAIKNVTHSAAVLTATFSQPAATVTAIQNATVSAAPLTGTFSLPAANIITPDVIVQSSVLSATLSLPATTITAIQNISVASSVLTATFSLPTSTVTVVAHQTISPSPLSATFTVPVPTVHATGWQKVAKPTTSFTKIAKAGSSWTKVAKL